MFDLFFIPVNKIHNYGTIFATKQSYSLPKARTNYGIYNIIFQGAKIWNYLNENIKLLSVSQFKEKLKIDIIEKYQ